ncbi:MULTISPECIES: alpha/beta fold hydrolase [Marinobacter]|jgi:pimeloyl-ACP methyl ester carboxylesterase|uniref:alpha/beta fold hydrolase n=1 Tax=Marinobacter TaxID=2742 RepID=UPI000C371954|nr:MULTISPECIES: alpha/beta hydrolase [Marinobacter]MAO14491.1 alpha/beta hydrolase [Marinobacter sp.]BEH13148.1 alpha/beta hydrolase [Marinobacter shengliensis]
MSESNFMKQPIPRSIVRLAHGRLSYLHSGSGTPVLFLHGLNGNGSSWVDQLSALAPFMEMWAWDAPGYGESDVAGSSVTALARVAIEFLSHCHQGPVNVVGHSMGGLVAMKIAILRPDLVNRLILSCTHPGHGLTDGANERYQRRLRELAELPKAEYGKRRATGMLPEGTDDTIFQRVADIAAESRQEGVANAALAIQTANLIPELARIQAPTQVITCDRDSVAPLTKAQPLLDHIPDVHHLELRGLGHAPYLEDAKQFNSAVSSFLLG